MTAGEQGQGWRVYALRAPRTNILLVIFSALHLRALMRTRQGSAPTRAPDRSRG